MEPNPPIDQDIILNLYELYLKHLKVSVDTRVCNLEDSIFFELSEAGKTKNNYASEALIKGAAFVVVSIDPGEHALKDRHIVVTNVLQTFQLLACHHRMKLNIPIIGITGSNGKTTTKELVKAALSKKYETSANFMNYNTETGVPLTVLRIKSSDEIAIVEMGARHLGDIDEVCNIARPTHGLITNLGPAHLGIFGSFENIVRGKAELYSFLSKNGGKIFMNSLEDSLKRDELLEFADRISYPNEWCGCQFVETEDPFVTFRSQNGQSYQTNLLGRHHFNNIASAVCLARYFGVEEDLVNQAIAEYVPDINRSEIRHLGSNTIVLDAYNANPVSMRYSIEAFSRLKGGYKIMILGIMAELGSEEERFHREIIALTRDLSGVDKVLLCGDEMCAVQEENPNAKFFKDKGQLEDYLKTKKFKNSTILLKACRVYEFETLVEFIKED